MAHFTQAKSGAVQIYLRIKIKKLFQPKFCAWGWVDGSSFQIFQMGFCRKCVTFGNHHMSVKDCSYASSGKTLAQFLAFASMSRKKENWAKTHIHEISNFISLFQFHIQGKIYEKLCLKGWVFAGRKITKVNWNWIYKVNSNIVFSSVFSEFEN